MTYQEYRLNLKNNGKPKEEKVVKPIAFHSKKRAKDQVKYRAIVKEELGKDDRCKVNSPECTFKATGMQHKKRRGKNLLNKEFMIACCNECNGYIERFPLWALEKGYSISVHKIQNPQ